MKKTFALVLALLLMCACTSAVTSSTQTPVLDTAETKGPQAFSDVPANAYYAEAVRWAVEEGVTKGTNDTTFSPDTDCTRGQIVTFLYRAAGSPVASGTDKSPFSDVAAGAYYAEAVRWAVEEGVTKGTSSTAFSPEAVCTRGQIVTFLYRAAGSPAASGTDKSPFSDVSSDAYYAEAVRWAVAAGITKGTSATTFSPDKTCTRAEAVTFLYRSAHISELPIKHILVAYFSATGNTAPLARTVAELLDADLYEIVPAQPYTTADLAYYTGGRCDQEQADPDCRPAIDGLVENMAQYDTVVIAHPIWHGQAPRIISTFLESYDFAGKTMATFCTSASSGLGSSAKNLYPLVSESVNWLESRRFPAGASRDDLAAWLEDIGLLGQSPDEKPVLKLTVNGTELSVAWADNSTVDALRELLGRVGPITLDMSDYAGFEKGAPLPETLPENNEPMDVDAGDIILYQGRQFVIYYDQNSWQLTPVGKIEGMTKAELQALLGEGNAEAVLSLS